MGKNPNTPKWLVLLGGSTYVENGFWGIFLTVKKNPAEIAINQG